MYITLRVLGASVSGMNPADIFLLDAGPEVLEWTNEDTDALLIVRRLPSGQLNRALFSAWQSITSANRNKRDERWDGWKKIYWTHQLYYTSTWAKWSTNLLRVQNSDTIVKCETNVSDKKLMFKNINSLHFYTIFSMEGAGWHGAPSRRWWRVAACGWRAAARANRIWSWECHTPLKAGHQRIGRFQYSYRFC